MNLKVKQLVLNKSLATSLVKKWLGTYNKTEISEKLKISRTTLNRRLELENWRYNELELINKHFNI